jgi:UTP--glucose-1-phosphate uridylyltransferase
MQKEVKKAIIAAAGLNSRMYPFTKEESKLFIQVINKPVVEYLVEELAASGIKEVIIVSNHTSVLKRFFSTDKRLNDLLIRLKKKKLIDEFRHIERLCKIDFIEQYEPMGWMHEVRHAKKYLEDGPFIVCFSDVLYQAKVPPTKQLINVFQKTNKNIHAHARFLFKPSVFDILKKEHFEVGSYDVDADVFNKLEQMNDALWYDIQGQYFNVGDPLSYVKTETAFALENPKFRKEYLHFLKEQCFSKEYGEEMRKLIDKLVFVKERNLSEYEKNVLIPTLFNKQLFSIEYKKAYKEFYKNFFDKFKNKQFAKKFLIERK